MGKIDWSKLIKGLRGHIKDLRTLVCGAVMTAVFFTFVGCSSRTFDTREDFLSHMADPDNGYVHKRTVNGLDVSITYRPTDLLVQQELLEGYGKSEVDSLRTKYRDHIYFNLSLSHNGQEVLNGLAGNRDRFGAMVNQLAFGMGEKIHLISKQRDTLEMADYVYPRLYGMGGGTQMLLVYPRDQNCYRTIFSISPLPISAWVQGKWA